MIGYSKLGRGFNASFPIQLSLRDLNKTNTAQSKVIIEGSRNSGMLVYNETNIIPLLNYIDNKKWFIAKDLTIGNNTIKLKAYDNIYHKYAEEQTINITRHQIDFSKQYKNYKVYVNNIDYSSYVSSFDIDLSNNLTVIKANVSFIGNFKDDINFDSTKEIKIEIKDGILPNFQEQFKGKIETKKFEFKNSEKITSVTALHNVINTLENKTSLWVKGTFNGDIQKELFNNLGYTNIWTFNRYKYSGKRHLADIKPMEIIKDIAAIQGEIVDIENNSINMIPDEYLNYPLFEFNESDILELTYEETKNNIFNKINVVYGQPTDNDKTGNNNNIQIAAQDSDIGYSFFDDENLKNKITTLPRNGTVYFGVWDKKILDFENITDARLIMVHDNEDYDIVGLEYELTLEVNSESKIAYTEICLNKYNLTKNSKLTFKVILQDENKKVYNPQINMSVEDTLKELSTSMNAFDAIFTSLTEVANVEIGLSLDNSVDELKSLSDRNPNIVYINSEFNNENKKTIYTFLYKIKVDECVLGSIDFDFDGINNKTSYINNAEIVTDNNNDLFGKKYIRAVTYAEPRTGYNRVKYIYILFKTKQIGINDIVIRDSDSQLIDPTVYNLNFKFKVFGRKFINNELFNDFENLKSEKTNSESINKYGLIDGGYLINNYLSSQKQAEDIASKCVDIFGYPLIKVTLQLPLISELKKNIMIKVISTNSGINSYYFIDNITKNFENCIAECYLMRITRLRRINGVDSEYDLYMRKMDNISLSPFLNSLLNQNKGLEKGIVTISHQDRTATVKIFGTNIKYTHIPVLNGLKPKKDDKVLVSLTADNTRIIIAILESYTDAIKDPDDTSDSSDNDIENSDGFKESDTKDTTILDSLQVSIKTNEINLWKYNSDVNVSQYTRTLKNCVIEIETNLEVDYFELVKRISITAEDGGNVSKKANITTSTRMQNRYISGRKVVQNPVKGIIISDIEYDYDKKYRITIAASELSPLATVDGKYTLTKNIEKTFTIEPKFGIQGIRVMGTNIFEIILTHPVADNFILENNQFLIVSE